MSIFTFISVALITDGRSETIISVQPSLSTSTQDILSVDVVQNTILEHFDSQPDSMHGEEGSGDGLNEGQDNQEQFHEEDEKLVDDVSGGIDNVLERTSSHKVKKSKKRKSSGDKDGEKKEELETVSESIVENISPAEHAAAVVVDSPKKQSSRRFRKSLMVKVLGVCILLLGVVLLTLPIWLNGLLIVKSQLDNTKGLKYKSVTTEKIAKEKGFVISEDVLKALPVDQNILVIPRIQVDAPINEGNSEVLLDYGVWRRPNGSNPVLGGNTILTSHRMDNLAGAAGPSTFYHLDKLQVGDEVIIYWNKEEFLFKVVETKIVKDTDVYIEDPSDETKITLYTCHPIWSSEERLVVIAKPAI